MKINKTYSELLEKVKERVEGNNWKVNAYITLDNDGSVHVFSLGRDASWRDDDELICVGFDMDFESDLIGDCIDTMMRRVRIYDNWREWLPDDIHSRLEDVLTEEIRDAAAKGAIQMFVDSCYADGIEIEIDGVDAYAEPADSFYDYVVCTERGSFDGYGGSEVFDELLPQIKKARRAFEDEE